MESAVVKGVSPGHWAQDDGPGRSRHDGAGLNHFRSRLFSKDAGGADRCDRAAARFCDLVERHDGKRFADLFCKDGVYHDVFYGEFAGRFS